MIREAVKDLLQVKKIIAILLTIGFLYLTHEKVVKSTEFIAIYSLVMGYYFGQSTVRHTTNELIKNKNTLK